MTPSNNQSTNPKKETKPTKINKTNKNYLPVIIIVVAIIVIAAGAFLYWNSQKGETNENVNTAQKQIKKPLVVGDVEEAFNLKAEKIDTLGVAPDSQFTLQSKNKITPDVLKASLVVSPIFGYKIESSDNNNFTITPEKPLSANTIYNFNLQAAKEADQTQKRDYAWAYQIKDTFKITGTIPKDEGTGVPPDTGIEITFSSENYYDYEKYISFSPEIKGRFEQHRKTLVYVPDKLSESTVYTVTVKKGLPITGSDEVLNDDYVFRFETPADYSSGAGNIYFQEPYYEYPSFNEPTLDLTEYNTGLSSIDVNVWKFNDFSEFENAIKQQLSIPGWAFNARHNFTVQTDSLTKSVSFSANIGSTEYYQKYINFPDKLAMGQYLVEFVYKDKKNQTFLQISDMSAGFYGSSKKGFVWLNDLSSKKPINGAYITFSGDSALKYTTDADGLTTFDMPSVLKDRDNASSDYYFIVNYQNNKLLIPVEAYNGYYYDYGGSYTQTNDYWAYLYTNRNLYMPSDTLKFWGLAKKREGENIKQVQAKLFASGFFGEEKTEANKETTLNVSSLGTYQGEIKYENLTPGTYRLKIYDGETVISTGYFNIETYTKPAYKIEIESSKKAVFAGDNVVFNVKTEFFDGTPVTNLKLKYTGSFGDGNFTTDLKGQFTLTLKTNYSGYEQQYFPEYNYFSVFPENAEMAIIESTAYVYTFGPHYKIDLSSVFQGNQGIINGTVKEISLDKINSEAKDFEWDYDGNAVPNIKVNLKIYHTYYDRIETGTYYDYINKTTYKTYRYEPREDLVEQKDVITDNAGAFQYNFAVEKEKDYRIDVRAVDGSNRTALTSSYLSSYTGYYEGFYSTSYNLQLNKKANQQGAIVYKVGELVDVMMRKGDESLPITDGKNYLYFKDKNGIFDVGTANSPQVSFNIEESYAPNIYLSIIYFDGRTYHYASKQINFDKKQKELNIEVTPDQDKFVPGDKAKLDLNVTDKNGKPVEAEVNVSIIDEALAAIQWAEPLNILGGIYSSIQSSITYSYVTDKELFAPMAEMGGCFGGETKITMSDGSQKSVKDVKIGDSILTKSNDKSRELVKSKVLNKKEHIVSEYLIINNQLKITPIHIVFLNGKWQMIGNAKTGDYLADSQGNKVIIKNIQTKHEYLKVYNLTTENQHTFLADGFYVHNEKGGARQNFQDIAYFDRVTTDASGNAQVNFTLPDNITSWQVTVQAITKDLEAAGVRNSLIVTKPFFVDLVMPENFLTIDKPAIKLRGFGANLNPTDVVNFEVSFPDKKDFGTKKYSVKVFESAEMELPEFAEGEHSIQVKAGSTIFEDTIIKKFTARKSNQVKNEVLYYALSDDLKIDKDIKLNATMTFSNAERGKYFSVLNSLRYAGGDRLDQKLARLFAEKYLNEYYGEQLSLDKISFADFQTNEGGISILPYASQDVLFTAKVLDLDKEDFDTEAAKDYFNRVINNKNSNLDEITYAYYGLAALAEPVLTDITNFMNNQYLPSVYKIYLARAVDKLGATEYAKSIVQKILTDSGENIDPYIRLILGTEHDDMIEYTYQAAVVLASSGASDASKLFDYAYQNPSQFHLNNLEILSYLSRVLPRLSGEPVSFTYSLDSKDKDVSLKNNEDYSLLVTPEQIKNIKFKNITGQVGLVVTYQSPVDITTEKTDKNISIKREYSVNGTATTSFAESDIVKITITPKIADKAIDNEYQITDYLPAGLKILTGVYPRGYFYDQSINYPYEINGQMVKFWSGKPALAFTYYAAVTGKGTYTAEAISVQGFVAKDSKAFGEAEVITIK